MSVIKEPSLVYSGKRRISRAESFLPKSGRRIHRACTECRKKTSKATCDR